MKFIKILWNGGVFLDTDFHEKIFRFGDADFICKEDRFKLWEA